MKILTVILNLRFFQLISAFFLFQCSFINASNRYFNLAEYERRGGPPDFQYYYSLNYTLNAMRSEKYKDNLNIRDLLEIYENYTRPRTNVEPKRIYPFIVIESYVPNPRRTLTKYLGRYMKAKRDTNLPDCIKHLQPYFMDGEDLEKIFNAISIYMTAFKVKYWLEESPVVLDGYWMQKVCVSLAKGIKGPLPPRNSSLLRFPGDLLFPDLTLFANPRCSNDKKYNYFHRMLKIRIHQFYRLMQEPRVKEAKFVLENPAHLRPYRRIVYRKLFPKFGEYLNMKVGHA